MKHGLKNINNCHFISDECVTYVRSMFGSACISFNAWLLWYTLYMSVMITWDLKSHSFYYFSFKLKIWIKVFQHFLLQFDNISWPLHFSQLKNNNFRPHMCSLSLSLPLGESLWTCLMLLRNIILHLVIIESLCSSGRYIL